MKQNYNKKSLALLGHGKWKSALGHTLLLIGFLTGFGLMGAFAQEPTNGLYMHKTWTPDPSDPTGAKGTIRLETFVTGDKIITEEHIPTDIVLVLDVSGSMNQNIYTYSYNPRASQAYSYDSYGDNTYYYLYNGQYYAVSREAERYGGVLIPRYYYRLYFTVNGQRIYLSGTGTTTTPPTNVAGTGILGNGSSTTIWTGVLYTRTQTSSQQKMAALKEAVKKFVSIVAKDATEYEVDHRISIVKYAGNRFYNANQSTDNPATATGAASLTEGNHMYNNNGYNYTEVVANRRNAANDSTWLKNQVDGLNSGGATAADFGMYKAQFVLAGIPADQMEERNKVVVMFTDGEPNHQNGFDNNVANRVIQYAHNLKHSWTNGGNTYQFDATVFTVGVFDDETDNIHTYMSRTSSNYPDATNMDDTFVQESNSYYFTAESAEGLSDIFEAIAGESGGAAMNWGSETVVQDVVSPSFQLNIPDNIDDPDLVIKAYAPKCIGKNGDRFMFDEEIDGNGFLTIGIDEDGNEGVVTGGAENRLPEGIVHYDTDTKTLSFTNFNFSAMYVAEEKDEQGTPLGIYTGRKLVMLIPLEVADGSWGDGIHTNGPLSVIYPNGDTLNPIPFNNPTANVLGSVWTEVIRTEPDGFDPNNIDSPEDLAWFISEVNGRIGYNLLPGEDNTNNVASHPDLNGRLTADIDMSAHNWVPIGTGYQVVVNEQTGLTELVLDNEGHHVKLTYEGTFDGNGHVITGLKNNASKYYKQITQDVGGVVVFPGMFSTVSGTVKNVFVLDSDFRGKHHNANFVHHGIIADTLTAGGNIFNCEAAGRITCNNDDPTNDAKLIYGGLVGLNEGTIHSSMAMATLTAYTMGGMIGENRSSFSNGFTNGVYNYLDNGIIGKYVGGIAGINTGTINNCYVRFERDNTNLDKLNENFGMIYGSNTGTNNVTNCYTPQIVTWSRPNYASATTAINTNTTVPTTAVAPDDYNTILNSYTLTVSPTFYNMFTNDNMTGGTWGTLGSYNVYNNGTPLLEQLNSNNGDGASWKRTTAGRYTDDDLTGYVSGDINDDYPVLQFDQFTCVGSADGIRLDYAASLNDMLHRHNNGNLNENTNINSNNANTQYTTDFYKISGSPAIYKGAINLYANDDVTLQTTGGKDDETVADNCTAQGVVVYIDENISLLQDASSTIEAYTGQTLQAYDNTELQAGERWHNISSSLKNSQFGWSYLNNDLVEHNWDSDPCGWNLNNYDEDYAFFPIDLSSYHRADFYCFYEPQYHWINFRRNSLSHWHMDDYEVNIPYNNEEQFIPGKGYLTTVDMSTWWAYNLNDNTISKQAQFMQNRGTLNNGNVNIDVTYTPTATYDLHGYKTGLEGYNLLGNPYQSYLDFDEFVEVNSDLLANSKFANTYAVYDPSQGNYVQYMSGSSKGSRAAGQYLNMHQGFFIQVNTSGTATFTNDMRSNDGTPNFRGEQPAYPLINFIVTDKDGNTDLAILEVNRRENDGAKKLRVGNATGRIFFRYNDEKLAIFFRDNAEGYQSLNFDASENGNFTLNWERANDNFSSLTLIDNITGVKTNMLTHDHYTFEGRIDDYTSRFKIVFGTLTDEDEEEPSIENFAFFNNGDLIVNGEGRLDIIDVLGRVLYSAELTDTQNTVNLPQNAKGVCMIRLTKGDNVKVQKFFVR